MCGTEKCCFMSEHHATDTNLSFLAAAAVMDGFSFHAMKTVFNNFYHIMNSRNELFSPLFSSPPRMKMLFHFGKFITYQLFFWVELKVLPDGKINNMIQLSFLEALLLSSTSVAARTTMMMMLGCMLGGLCKPMIVRASSSNGFRRCLIIKHQLTGSSFHNFQ